MVDTGVDHRAVSSHDGPDAGRRVFGAADPRFACVVRAFASMFPGRRFGGGALAVYLDGQPVVDVWKGWADRAGWVPWSADSAPMVFSATKGMTATVIHRLADRGLIDYEAPVAEYWPAFGANGKATLTVRDVMRHQAGLSGLRGATQQDLLDHVVMEERLAAAVPGRLLGKSAYHALTFGWLMSGLARAVTGKDMRLAGLWQITGFYQVPMSVNKAWKGTTTYTFRRKVATLVDNVTSFSNKPRVFIFYLGAAIFIISSSAAGYLIIDRIFFRALQAGWASVIVSIWMLGGVTIFCIGLVGIYVSKVFIETKQRPYTIIRRIYGSDLTTREPSSLKTAFPAAHLSNGKRVTSEPEGLATGNR